MQINCVFKTQKCLNCVAIMYLISYNDCRVYLIHRKEKNVEQALRKEFKIYEVYNGKKTIPQIRINGIWLQELGFNIGDKISLDFSSIHLYEL